MRTYGVFAYGLYVTDYDLKNYANKHNMEEDAVAEESGMELYGNADGDITSLYSNNTYSVDEYFYIATVNRYPSLFYKAYNDKEEALQELKERYGQYLPKDFDYEEKFVKYLGTVWC